MKNKQTILLVEDDFALASMYLSKLGSAGYDTKHASNGLEALRSVENTEFDLILLDLKMPVMTGEEFLEKFRKIHGPDAKVLILTNISRSEAPKTLWHLGISGYFVKAHHTPSQLIEEISKIMSSSN